MKRIILAIIGTVLIASISFAHNPKVWRKMRSDVNIFMASDVGREGCYDQQVIAELMNSVAAKVKPECVVLTGDTHHGNGVKSTDDNDWQENFEAVYHQPRLMKIDWYAALGNHEYRGNTQAVLDYSQVSHRWKMPERYYTKVFEARGTTVRLVVIDTTPLIDKYHKRDKYRDVNAQDKEQQLEWLDSVLSNANEDWVVVAGHHPIHADTKKAKIERTNMRNTVDKILNRYDNVAMYVCGHIHNFQHLRDKGSDIDYIVNSSAALSRSVKTTKRTIYCSHETGFSILSANEKSLSLYMVDKNGNVLHTVNRHK